MHVRLLTAITLAIMFLPLQADAAQRFCDGRPATLVGTPGKDLLVGAPGDDVIVGLGGDDWIIGMGGNDVLCGNGGADRLRGGAGADRLFGGAGGYISDGRGTYSAGDHLWGGAGNDHYDGGLNAPTGNPDPDSIHFEIALSGITFDAGTGTIAGQGRDTVTPIPWRVLGSAHDDVIIGGSGRDDLRGKRGNDQLRGGDGTDQVVPRGGHDTCIEFEQGMQNCEA